MSGNFQKSHLYWATRSPAHFREVPFLALGSNVPEGDLLLGVEKPAPASSKGVSADQSGWKGTITSIPSFDSL